MLAVGLMSGTSLDGIDAALVRILPRAATYALELVRFETFPYERALRDELLGKNPSVLEELLVRRVVNGWLATHALELELTLRPPGDARDRAHLDAALTRAQKRMTEAVRELARVRRLQAPAILAQLNVSANQTVVNGAPNVSG